jgi:O-antigen ligase
MDTFKEKLIRKIFTALFYLISFGLPLLVPSWHGKILIGAILVWILVTKGAQIAPQFLANRLFQTILLFIAINFSGLLFSLNLKSGWATIESLLPLSIIPLIIFSSRVLFDNKLISYILISFLAGVIFLNLTSLFFISYDLWDPVNLQSNIILANNTIVKIHPVFLSLYISFCVFFLIDQFFPLDTSNRVKTGWVLFSLVILIVYLFWINSRTGMLAFFIAAIFYIFYKFRRKQRLISLSLLVLIAFLIVIIPFSRERFLNAPLRVLRGEASTVTSDRNTYTLTVRKQILDCSIELLKGPEFFYGYGTGDFRDEIQKCYQEKGYVRAFEEGLDQHNEYFAQLHRHGIIGLVLFLALLAIPFHHALKYHSPLLAVFIILFAFTAFFENVFSAQKGVTFFALMCPLLMALARKQWEDSSQGTSEVNHMKGD